MENENKTNNGVEIKNLSAFESAPSEKRYFLAGLGNVSKEECENVKEHNAF